MKNKRFEIIETEGTAKEIYVIVDRKTGVNYLATKLYAYRGYRNGCLQNQ